MIKMRFYHLVLGRIATNTYILAGENGAVVIDPAAECEKIDETLRNIDRKADYVLLTHAHFDHCGAAAEL